MDVAFNALGWIPKSRPDMDGEMVDFPLNYTFWLNLSFGILAIALFVIARRHPPQAVHFKHHAQGHDAHHAHHH